MSNQPIDNRVQLGCGSLILIIIIVMVFSGGSDSNKMQRQLDEMNRKIDHLSVKIDALSRTIGGPAGGNPVAPPDR